MEQFGVAIGGYSMSLLSNSPFWSLSYEMGFYAMYCAGMVLLMKHRQTGRQADRQKILFSLLVMALFGHAIFAAFILWLGGLILHRITNQSCEQVPRMVFFLTFATLFWLEIYHHPGQADSYHGVLEIIFSTVHVSEGRLSRHVVLGMLGFLTLQAPLLSVIRRANFSPGEAFTRACRKAGEITFPLYLFHFPILVFLKSSGIWTDKSISADILIVGFNITLSLTTIPLCDRLKSWIRNRLDEHFHLFWTPQTR